MRTADNFPKQVLQQMHKAFFDVSPEGVLTYRDPMIGLLANQEKQLAVTANPKKARLELRVRGVIEQVFELSQGIGQTCRDAFHAYFVAFESLCRNQQPATQAA
jgi:hypothetical protein